eukprot:PLAT1160.1.p1 GENE.PLAT1160.1~~PLAT1160.1.p1  ORF type:complete len:245 (+),score=87.58 PLAT1160.1:26-760(+)
MASDDSLLVHDVPRRLEDGGSVAASEDASYAARTADVLHSLLPPKRWTTEEGETLVQYVSVRPVDRLGVLDLADTLDARLEEQQSRETGLCPVREELYSQLFDEMIRQITLISPERGLLLLRVRDQLRMTIASYQTLYATSLAFGMRKTMQADELTSELVSQSSKLEAEVQERRALILQLQDDVERLEEDAAARGELDERRRAKELDVLRFQAEQLQTFLAQRGVATESPAPSKRSVASSIASS